MENIKSFSEVKFEKGSFSSIFDDLECLGVILGQVFNISLKLKPFKFNNKIVTTHVELVSIKLPIKLDWREIEGKTFELPFNPQDIHIEPGTVYLEDVHNLAYARTLSFGKIDNGKILCKFTITFDFTLEGPKELGKPTIEGEALLDFDEKELDQVTKEAKS
jgi:hypothetical protein